MLKKSDILPAILAFISTAILIAFGFTWFKKINTQIASNHEKREAIVLKAPKNNQNLPATQTKPVSFAPPNIVPQGTSVYINGSTRMILANQALKKSFQRRFPGTAIIPGADGSEIGMELLRTGEIDIAAILRPLTQEEKEQGFAAVTVDELATKVDNQIIQEELYYVYQKPANMEVEAFLGFALSSEGQEALANR